MSELQRIITNNFSSKQPVVERESPCLDQSAYKSDSTLIEKEYASEHLSSEERCGSVYSFGSIEELNNKGAIGVHNVDVFKNKVKESRKLTVNRLRNNSETSKIIPDYLFQKNLVSTKSETSFVKKIN